MPKVSEAFLPTAKVASMAKEVPLPGSSNEVAGSTKGLSVAIVVVVISHQSLIALASLLFRTECCPCQRTCLFCSV